MSGGYIYTQQFKQAYQKIVPKQETFVEFDIQRTVHRDTFL